MLLFQHDYLLLLNATNNNCNNNYNNNRELRSYGHNVNAFSNTTPMLTSPLQLLKYS